MKAPREPDFQCKLENCGSVDFEVIGIVETVQESPRIEERMQLKELGIGACD